MTSSKGNNDFSIEVKAKNAVFSVYIIRISFIVEESTVSVEQMKEFVDDIVRGIQGSSQILTFQPATCTVSGIQVTEMT